ncbi:MAG: hypothetical protein U5K56_08485 [Halioglobus sp.]|nr:hypothetical protein [Halioglobus sp.]
MSLADGGHLTHGAPPNFSGKLYNAVQYGLDPDTSLVDYDRVEALAQEHRPRMIVAGFSAYSQVMDWARFRAIADGVGAWLVVDMAHVAGLVAAGVDPEPGTRRRRGDVHDPQDPARSPRRHLSWRGPMRSWRKS